MGITKTDFMRGMQCRKMLWLDKHKPGLRVIPPEVQERLDAGNAFGDLAMGMFGPYEEMTVYRPGTTIPDKKAMLEKTQDALSRGVPVICEAAFSNYNNYCAADILRKTEKPVLRVVNKVYYLDLNENLYEFYELGLGDPIGISSVNMLGFGDLLDRMIELFPEDKQGDTEETPPIQLAIVRAPPRSLRLRRSATRCWRVSRAPSIRGRMQRRRRT